MIFATMIYLRSGTLPVAGLAIRNGDRTDFTKIYGNAPAARRRLLEDYVPGEFECFTIPVDNSTVQNGTTAQDLIKACIDKEMFVSGELANKCVIAKLNIVPNTDVDAYPVLTADYDPFEPYTYPTLGKVFALDLFDCDTQLAFNLTNIKPG